MDDELSFIGQFEQDDFQQIARPVWADDEDLGRVEIDDDQWVGDGMQHVEFCDTVLGG